MKTISAFLTMGMIFISISLQARLIIFNIDSIYANADFCDRVDIVNYDTELGFLSVKSHLDSLTYSFTVGYNIKDFLNSEYEYLLIRGRVGSDPNQRETVVLGVLKNGKWAFTKLQRLWSLGAFCITTSNSSAILEKKQDWVEGNILYPKKYFTYKTPSVTWSQEEIESNPFLYAKENFTVISFDSLNGRYFNDTIYVRKTTINPKHIQLMFNVTQTKNSTQDCYDYLASILVALQLPYEKILESSQDATCEVGHQQVIFSYSNASYKLVIFGYTMHARNEDFSFLDLYLK